MLPSNAPTRTHLAWLGAGLAIGLVIGLNAAGWWPQVPIHAVATHGQENFAICTTPMDEDVEAVFVLDDLTGDSPRLRSTCKCGGSTPASTTT